MTWIEVVDSAVKIGLGALIASVTSLVVTRSNQRHEGRKELSQRRHEVLAQFVTTVETIAQCGVVQAEQGRKELFDLVMGCMDRRLELYGRLANALQTGSDRGILPGYRAANHNVGLHEGKTRE